MKRKLSVITVLLFISLAGRAQANDEHFIILLSPQIGFALGNLQATNAVALGGRLGFDFALKEKLRLTTAVGSITYSGKAYNNAGYKETYDEYALLQAVAGLKYFYYDRLFCSMQVGAAGSVWQPGLGWGYTYAPALGFEFGNGVYYDVSIRYENNVIKGKNGQGLIFSVSYEF